MKKTLKNIAIIAILGIILLTLTGCANVNYDIKLNEDGSGDISYVMGYDKSFLVSMGVETSSLENYGAFDDTKEQATKNGYTIEDYEDDTTYGFKASKHVNNIQEEFNVNDEVFGDSEESNGIVYEKTVLKTKYSQDSKIDLTDMGEDEDAAMLKALMSQMKISYKITLPFKAGSNNAATVSEDGKTLEWTLKAGEVNEIKFEASQDYGMYGLVGVALVLLVAAIVGTVILKRTKKAVEVKSEEPKKEETTPVAEETQTEEKNEVVEEEIEIQEVEDTEVVSEEAAIEKEETVEEKTVTEEVINEEEKAEEEPLVEETEESDVEDETK